MRLSESRLRQLSKKIAKDLMSSGAVRATGGVDDLTEYVSRAMMLDQKAEADIEAEARQFLARQRNLPPPGTGEYQAAFSQAKRNFAQRKGFVL